LSSPAALAFADGPTAILTGVAHIGVGGFVLSYDALEQVAVAIHIRGLLTYAFPLVIDGFIAIGIGALLILRNAPMRSRLYAWVLVGTATATSIWANALHAIHLNHGTRLRLDDLTVGALSAIAPLALAGAVHLYLVIRRHLGLGRGLGEEGGAPYRRNGVSPDSDSIGHHQQTHAHEDESGLEEASPEDPADEVADDVTDVADSPEPPAKRKGRAPSATMDQLVAIGRTAPLGRDDRVSRRNVESVIRAKGHSVARDRLDEATRRLQTERDQPAARAA
jgi:hypothetical protein